MSSEGQGEGQGERCVGSSCKIPGVWEAEEHGAGVAGVSLKCRVKMGKKEIG